ncbi:hypothetical protein MBLNU13_g05132t2 [Cladosporium sp. NU13]
MSLPPSNLEFEFEFEFSPPQSPPVRPTKHVADESPTTPKRKRELHDDYSEDHGSPSKRSSPLQQVATPDTPDLTSEESHPEVGASSQTQPLTPMKRSISSGQEATPVTPVKGVNRFHLDSNSSPSGDGFADPSNLASGTASPSLVKPRLIDFTASLKSEASSNASASAATAIGLDSDSTGDGINHTSAIDNDATKKQAATLATPFTRKASPTASASQRFPSDQILRPANPTPNKATAAAVPQKPLSALQKILAIAPQYVPVYVSPDSPVKLRDSKQFCINPPFWKRWPKDQYLALAHYPENFVVSHHTGLNSLRIMRSYKIPEKAAPRIEWKIFQAARATSAAMRYFEPITIDGVESRDGGLVGNNPVALLHVEAGEVFEGREQIITVAEDLANIATDTERIADEFFRHDGSKLANENRYFRFNVPEIGEKGLAESSDEDLIYLEEMTLAYVDKGKTAKELRTCSAKLAEGASVSIIQSIPVHEEVAVPEQMAQPTLEQRFAVLDPPRERDEGTGEAAPWLLSNPDIKSWLRGDESAETSTIW